FNTGVAIDDDQFHLVGISKSSTNTYTAYVDSTTYNVGTSAASLLSTPISFGERPNTGTQFPFLGMIDDVRFYNRVLTALDIQALLAQPTPSPAWIANASGSWHSGVNWSTSVPNSNTATATLSGIISANRTVAVDSPVTVKNLTFANATAGYTIGGTS